MRRFMAICAADIMRLRIFISLMSLNYAIGVMKIIPAAALALDGQIMPVNIIEKPPTAELSVLIKRMKTACRPYEVLDDILECLIEGEMRTKDIVSRVAMTLETVARIQHLLYIAEYKRRQSPPGVKDNG